MRFIIDQWKNPINGYWACLFVGIPAAYSVLSTFVICASGCETLGNMTDIGEVRLVNVLSRLLALGSGRNLHR